MATSALLPAGPTACSMPIRAISPGWKWCSNDVQPLLLGSNLRDDNSALTVDLTNSDVYRGGRLVLQKDTLHIVRSIFLWRGTAYQRIGSAKSRRPAGELRSDAAVRQRFRRPVRGARRAPSAPRRRLQPSCSARPMSCSNITGSTARPASPPCISIRGRRGLPSMRRPIISNWRRRKVTALFVAVSCNKPIMQKPAPFFRGLLAHRREMRRSTRGRGQHRNVEQHLQRGAVPGDGRPQHADDRNAAGPISLCGHSLVFDDVRPRRPDHRAADAVGRSAHCPRRAAAARFLPGQERSIRSPTPSPARSCTRCAAARWRRCARCRSRNITAASIRRRCSCCWPASMSNAPATRRRWPNCGPRSRRRCNGSTAPAIPIATASSNTSARPSRGLPIRAGRIPSTRSSMPMGNSPKAISRWRKFRATSSPASGWRRAARGGWD